MQGIRNAFAWVAMTLVLTGMSAVDAFAQGNGARGQASPPAASSPTSGNDIMNLDIEQLGKVSVRSSAVAPTMDTEVTSVAKQESTVARSAAAIYVITSEMIRRSPANNIPDLLRMVPGLEVARIDAHTWAITSRGFNGRFANKLLVLVDGRTVFSPINSGTYWDVQEMPLEDIERIEIIRGPGGTLWGANAVNGVINIISKKAKDTQGALLSYGGGTEDRALGVARYGGSNGQGLYWRVYGKQIEEAPGSSPSYSPDDGWRQGRGGFRAIGNPIATSPTCLPPKATATPDKKASRAMFRFRFLPMCVPSCRTNPKMEAISSFAGRTSTTKMPIGVCNRITTDGSALRKPYGSKM